MSNEKLSVIIPCYNVESYIVDTINSLKNQTFSDFKIICIDDCSTDKTFEILQSMSENERRLTCYRNNSNSGVVSTLNKLIALTDTEWILRMDSDDIFEPTRIEKLLKLATDNNLKVASSFYSFIDMEGKNILNKSYINLCTLNKSIRFMAIMNSPFPSQALFHNSVLTSTPYSKQYKVCEDYFHFVEILADKKVLVGNLPEKLYKYRINTKGLSATNAKLMRENHLQIAQNYGSKLLSIQKSDLDFLKIGLKLLDYQKENKSSIIKLLNGCFYVRDIYLKCIPVNKDEFREINFYTNQYFLYMIVSFLKSEFNAKDKLSILLQVSPLILKVMKNPKIFKWILDNL